MIENDSPAQRSADIPVRQPRRPTDVPADRNVRAPRAPSAWFGRLLWLPALTLLCGLLCGCASAPPQERTSGRPFEFERDTLAYPNELVWVYGYDAEGNWKAHRREPKPDYSLHCFVVARTVRQFFENARFEPAQAVADEATYRQLVRRVVATSPAYRVREPERIVLPGYADLRAFSRAHEKLLKEECGGAWQSYFQRGHWRMVFPFSRSQQEEVAEQLLTHLTPDHPVIVHLARFPQLSINHAVVVFGAKATEKQIEFATYDPNQPERATVVVYDRPTRTFIFPQCNYFPGGRVDVYEVYWKWNY
jgi:hypothetical protein